MQHDIFRTLTALLIGLTVALAVVMVVGFTTTAHSHPGRTDAQGCHAGKQPKHCHTGARTTPRQTTTKSERVCVYQYTRADGSPAYIGISNDPQRRFRQHSDDGRPFARMTKRVQSCYSTRRDALREEKRLIQQHCPTLFNKTHCK